MSILNFWKSCGVLGMNDRILNYLTLNNKQATKLADDKLRTKSFLSARGVTVPKLINKITTHTEAERFSFASLPSSFVVKPNHGFGGEGILVLEKDGTNFRTISGEILTQNDLRRHMIDIVDGRFSLGGYKDEAFVEQRLILDHRLTDLTPAGGLPDVRIIYYNMLPIMAQLRLPTRKSGGKANVHLGGVGVGIDLATGKTTYATQYNKFVDSIPEVERPLAGIEIPNWDEMLLMGSKIQNAVDLGYLAVDIVPDEFTGPTLLEINARAGLMVQVANRAPLRHRLQKAKGIKVNTPEKAVSIAKDIFGANANLEGRFIKEDKRTIVGLKEDIELILPHGRRSVRAKLNPNSDRTFIDEKIISQLKFENPDLKIVKFVLADERKKTVVFPYKPLDDTRMILGKNVLSNILIDPKKSYVEDKIKEKSSVLFEPTEREKYLQYDKVLADLDNKIKLLFYMRPSNLDDEKKKFLDNNDYNPQFKYRNLKFDVLDFKARLSNLNIELGLPSSKLFLEKKAELFRKIKLLEARGTDNFVSASEEFFTAVNDDILKLAEKDAKLFEEAESEDQKITAEELGELFNAEIEKYELQNWKVKFNQKFLAACTVSQRKQQIVIRTGEKFTKKRVQKLLLHEFFTHVFTTVNGEKQIYQLLKTGFSDYLKTQEGLAIYNQTHFANPKNETGMSKSALLYTVVAYAMKKSFRQTFEHLIKKGFGQEFAWKMTLKAKRGMGDTSKAGSFTKDLLYYEGYLEICEFVKNGGSLSRLYLGKLALCSLEDVENLKGIKPPSLLPNFLLQS